MYTLRGHGSSINGEVNDISVSDMANTRRWPNPPRTGHLPQFYRRSRDVESSHSHKLIDNPSSLEKRPIIALISPTFVQIGRVCTLRPGDTVKKAEVIIDDPLGQPGDWCESDVEAEAAWQKNLPADMMKKRKTQLKREREQEQEARKTKEDNKELQQTSTWAFQP